MSSDLYYFNYVYKDSSYYYGYAYASSGTYYSGESINTSYGTYNITADYKGYGSSSDKGKVYVDYYYDAGSGKGYTPQDYSKGFASGSSYIQSESDSISTASGSKSFNDYQEAKPTDLYYFDYVYQDGSYYYGYAYASSGTYYSGENINTGYGTYNIAADHKDYYGSSSDEGKVYVDYYYDAGSGKGYTPQDYSKGFASGSYKLESESDSISTASGSKSFNDYQEAKPTDLYYFDYVYKDGSYYYGYAYASSGTYYSGESITTGYGTYNIAADHKDYYGSSSDEGKVYVDYYYDAGSGKGYTPQDYSKGFASGSYKLESESDSIYTASGYESFDCYWEA